MDTVNATIEGTSPLLMANGQMADPMNVWARELKKITAKSKKTDEDYKQMAYIQFMGHAYHDKEIGPFVPGDNIAVMVRDGGKVKKRGAAVQRGVECLNFRCPLVYEGPRDLEDMWDIGAFHLTMLAKNGSTGARVLCTRPQFKKWKVSFSLFYEPRVINLDDLRQCVEDAGIVAGVGAYRPGCPHGGRYGRFKLIGWEASNG